MFCGEDIFLAMSLLHLKKIQMGVVGANTWRGGFESYSTNGQLLSSYEPGYIVPDSYLGKEIK